MNVPHDLVTVAEVARYVNDRLFEERGVRLDALDRPITEKGLRDIIACLPGVSWPKQA